MKKLSSILAGLMLLSAVTFGQFKSQAEQPGASQSFIRPASTIGSLLGLINPENLLMRHNFSLSYISSGGTGLSMASYTNSIFYKISDPLNVRFDLTLQGSPSGQSQYQKNLSGLFLSRAELNYRPWENFIIKFEYNHLPGNFYGRYSPWYNSYSPSMWGDE